MDFHSLFEDYAEEPLTRHVMLTVLKKYKRPNDKIAELVKAGLLTTLKNGLYIPGPKSKILKPEPFLIANHLRGPSYVSMEAALSYWNFIPERVYEISSVTIKASKTYKTDVGRFSYKFAALPYYAFGLRSVKLTSKQVVMIASPEKAICDKIVMTSGVFLRSSKQVLEFLTEDMRIDEDLLKKLNLNEIDSWMDDAPKQTSLQMLTKTLHAL